jgi:hypothetical protein
MNFNELYKKIYDLDKPVIAEGCGDMGMGDMMGSDRQMPPAHPSMSVNLNAQGMDSIESLLRLMTKVNPDMLNKKDSEPALTAMPSIASIISTSDRPEMLPAVTDEPDHGMSVDIDGIDIGSDDDMSRAQGDQDDDGDHDMRDHELETDYEDDDKKEGAYDASTTPDPQYQDSDFMLNKLSGGLGKQQTMHKHSYKQGDNPMSMESVESIREGLTNLYQQYKSK